MKPIALSLLAFVIVCALSVRTSANVERANEITDATPGQYQGKACTGESCNEGDGCAWASCQYTWWYPKKVCEEATGGAAGDHFCTQRAMWCREDQFHVGFSGCDGEIWKWTRFANDGCSRDTPEPVFTDSTDYV